jgi:hypothetical protein
MRGLTPDKANGFACENRKLPLPLSLLPGLRGSDFNVPCQVVRRITLRHLAQGI